MSSMNAQDLSRFMSDGTAGAGNFLPRALAISRFPDEALVFPDSPYRSLSGREYRALSLAELDAVAEEFASFYHEHGVIPKDVIAVYLDDGIDFLIQYLALTRLGAIAAFVNGNLPASIAAPYMLRISASGAMVSADRRPRSWASWGVRIWRTECGTETKRPLQARRAHGSFLLSIRTVIPCSSHTAPARLAFRKPLRPCTGPSFMA